MTNHDCIWIGKKFQLSRKHQDLQNFTINVAWFRHDLSKNVPKTPQNEDDLPKLIGISCKLSTLGVWLMIRLWFPQPFLINWGNWGWQSVANSMPIHDDDYKRGVSVGPGISSRHHGLQAASSSCHLQSRMPSFTCLNFDSFINVQNAAQIKYNCPESEKIKYKATMEPRNHHQHYKTLLQKFQDFLESGVRDQIFKLLKNSLPISWPSWVFKNHQGIIKDQEESSMKCP